MMTKIILYVRLFRLHKPVGILLLLWPALWALWLANHGMPSFHLVWIFILGAIVTRSAGCIINDIFDRQFDLHVERTKNRPLTSQQLSLNEALISLFILAILALSLALQLNILSIKLSTLAAAIAVIYPLMKRITYFPQVILGIAFSMSIFIAYAASINSLPWNCWLLFGVSILWPLMYDTAYALADYSDDLKIGIKSTALFFKNQSFKFIVILQTLLILGFIMVGIVEKLHVIYFLAVLVSAGFFIYQQRLLKNQQAFAAFLNNQWVGFILWLGIALNYL